MGQESTDIREAIRTLAGVEELSSCESRICIVSNINNTLMTCDCSPVNGDADFIDVLLCVNKKNGFVLIPKDGSFVSVTQLNETDAFVSMVSEVDSILLNGNASGGIVKVIDLTTKLNDLVSQLQSQLTLIATGITSAGGTYTPGTLSNFNKSDYENTKVLNG